MIYYEIRFFGKHIQIIIIRVPFSNQHLSLGNVDGVKKELQIMQRIIVFTNTRGIAKERISLLYHTKNN